MPALAQIVADYLEHLRARNYSPRSLTAYAGDLARLVELTGAQADPAGLSGHDIRRYLARLHARGLSARSLARILSAWRGLFRYLVRQGRVLADPCAGIRPPRGEKRLPHALSPEEMARLLADSESETDDPFGLQDRAMFELMYSSGLRLSELVGLSPTQIDAVAGEVRVVGKGGKTRIVPVGRAALTALAAWMQARAQLPAVQADALFVGKRGRRIAPRVVQARLKVLALRQGVDRRVHPHALRHSFASHVLQSSGDLRAVQEMLGHASLSSTQVYTHLDFQHLARIYDQAHPRAKKK